MRVSYALLATQLGASCVSAQNGTWPWQTYRSSSAEPPELSITTSGDPTYPGYLFFDQNGPKGHSYNLFIMDEQGELVWQSPARGDYSAFRAQTFQGEPVLTFFNGVSIGEPYGWGYGAIQILSSSYESIYNVSLLQEHGPYRALGGFNDSLLVSWVDIHEAHITEHDTMLVTMYNLTRGDLSSIGGPVDGWITDSLFYEIDIATNEILFEWSALDHTDDIPLSDVLEFYPLDEYGRNSTLPYGYFHINSVETFKDGSYLVSSRFFSSVFKISKEDGSVEWTFQGNDGGDFELGEGISFRYQHDARIHEETEDGFVLSIFNNDNSDITYGVNQTTGLYIHLDTSDHKATLAQELTDPRDAVYSASQGNLQRLPDGHSLMGYGSTPKIKEYDAGGRCVMTARFGDGDGTVFSYRAYKGPWVGRPKAPPAVHACAGPANETAVYMSWNGATEHEQWNVFAAGPDNRTFTLVGSARRDGFETRTTIPGRPPYVYVEALGGHIEPRRSQVVAAEKSC